MAHIFVVGNEKGGAGKTTCCMHLITALLDQGYKVSSMDADSRQHSLTTYLENRDSYNKNNPKKPVPAPNHFLIPHAPLEMEAKEREKFESAKFTSAFEKARSDADYVIIDTPGTYSFLSCLAHSHADTVITPINDSFIDLSVIAKIDENDYSMSTPSIYSQMLWEQKMEKAKRSGGSIDWVVIRNRVSSVDAVNKRNVEKAIESISKRISFKVAPGFSERVIFRELFLHGLTLVDLPHANIYKSFSLSHVAARAELRNLMSNLSIKLKP